MFCGAFDEVERRAGAETAGAPFGAPAVSALGDHDEQRAVAGTGVGLIAVGGEP